MKLSYIRRSDSERNAFAASQVKGWQEHTGAETDRLLAEALLNCGEVPEARFKVMVDRSELLSR